MRAHRCTGTALSLLLLGCSGGSLAGGSELTESAPSAVQGGTEDATHTFVVGVGVNLGSVGQVTCSGTLLAPNLVATARHCVAQVTSPLDCTATFGATLTTGLVVSTDASLSKTGNNIAVAQVLTPDTTSLCGADLALLILDGSITLPKYAEPVLTPMTDHTRWDTTVTAIGYGATDANGDGVGVRRIRQNVALACIPNDTGFADCCADVTEAKTMSTSEFHGGDGVCEGDSGSGAFEKKSFDAGTWASFGVLSRGGTSSDGTTCTGSVYTRFDAWGAFVADAATQAASAGGYAVPSWASTYEGGGAASFSPGTCSDTSLKADGVSCKAGAECASSACVTAGGQSVCASPCAAGGVCQGAGFVCEGTPGYCLANAGAASGAATSGCSAAPSETAPSTSTGLAGLAMAVALCARRRRRARR